MDKEVIFCIVKSKRESELEDMFLESKYLDLLPTEGIPWQKYLHNQQKNGLIISQIYLRWRDVI